MSWAPEFVSDLQRERPPASMVQPFAVARFRNLVMLAGAPPPQAGDLVEILLGAVLPAQHRGCEALRSLWAEEAVHRAYTLVRLIDARNRIAPSTKNILASLGLERIAAQTLAQQLAQLELDRERRMLPCAPVLRGVVSNLATLFGRPANVATVISTDTVSLPAYKRRALVLAAAELVSNALLHGRDAIGRIEVSLSCHGATSACLRVVDDGVGFASGQPNLPYGVAAGLADLLEAELTYNRSQGWTIAEIRFPVPAF